VARSIGAKRAAVTPPSAAACAAGRCAGFGAYSRAVEPAHAMGRISPSAAEGLANVLC